MEAENMSLKAQQRHLARELQAAASVLSAAVPQNSSCCVQQLLTAVDTSKQQQLSEHLTRCDPCCLAGLAVRRRRELIIMQVIAFIMLAYSVYCFVGHALLQAQLRSALRQMKATCPHVPPPRA
jgi:hypothetical protein